VVRGDGLDGCRAVGQGLAAQLPDNAGGFADGGRGGLVIAERG